MRPKKKVYQYNQNNELLAIYESVQQAARANNDSTNVIKDTATGKRQKTRKGFTYTYQPIQPIENEQEFFFKEEKQKKGIRKIGKFEYETTQSSDEVFHLEKSKEARKKQLKDFIYRKLEYRWKTIYYAMAMLEKEFVDEILESL